MKQVTVKVSKAQIAEVLKAANVITLPDFITLVGELEEDKSIPSLPEEMENNEDFWPVIDKINELIRYLRAQEKKNQ